MTARLRRALESVATRRTVWPGVCLLTGVIYVWYFLDTVSGVVSGVFAGTVLIACGIWGLWFDSRKGR